jgi:predicted dehydrogenase
VDDAPLDGGVIGKTAVIIGGGAAGADFHLPRLSRICGAGTVSVVEPDHGRLALLRDRFRGRDDIVLTPELPPDGRYSLGVVATPAKFRREYVERLRDRCATLVVEPPIARTYEEAEAIVDQLERGEAIGFVCQVRRTLGNFRFVKQILADGILGDLQSVSVREGDVSAWQSTSLGSFSRDLNGGGVLIDTGAHTLDLLFQVFDELTLKRSWMDADIARSRKAVEANCILELEDENGVPIGVVLSRNRHLSNKADFQFARGLLTLGVRDNTLELAVTSGCRLHGVPSCASAQHTDLNSLYDAYYERYVASGTNHAVSPRDSLKAMRLIDDAYSRACCAVGGF